MAFTRLRRALLLALCAGSALLAACGGGSVESQFTPTRVVAFGDGTADLGQVNARRYTVNDGSVNIWTQQLASRYGVTLTAAAAGGTSPSLATRNARISAATDAAGGSAPSVTAQVDAFLAGNALRPDDLVVVSAGVSDVVYQAMNAGSDAAAQAALQAEARALATQVRRLLAAGAQRVLVAGSYNLGRSPWAAASGRSTALQNASSAFNDALLVALVDLGKNVLYVDAAYYFNLVTGTPSAYSMDNAVAAVCTSVDDGTTDPIGIGAGQVNSALCDAATVGGLDYARYVFADAVYFTPQANRLFGNYAYDRMRARW